MVTRPRPVYRSFFDADGDCIKNKLVEWRFMRHLIFDGREDQLGLRSVQYSIKHEDVAVELDPDVYK